MLTSTRSPRGLAEILIEIVFLAGQPSVARLPSAVGDDELVLEEEKEGIASGALRDGKTLRGRRGFRVRAGQHDDRVGRSHAVAVGAVPEGQPEFAAPADEIGQRAGFAVVKNPAAISKVYRHWRRERPGAAAAVEGMNYAAMRVGRPSQRPRQDRNRGRRLLSEGSSRLSA